MRCLGPLRESRDHRQIEQHVYPHTCTYDHPAVDLSGLAVKERGGNLSIVSTAVATEGPGMCRGKPLFFWIVVCLPTSVEVHP